MRRDTAAPSVVIADGFSKVVGGMTRSATLPYAKQGLLETQLGSGLHGGAIDVAHLLLRSMCDAALVRGHSAAIIFLDLASAFASVARSLAIQTEVTDEELVRRLRTNGFETQKIVDILGEFHRFSVWDKSVTPDQLRVVLRQFLNNAWLALEAVSGVLLYTSGATAGTPLVRLGVCTFFR